MIRQAIGILCFLGLTTVAVAATTSPVGFIESIAQRMLGDLQAQKSRLNHNSVQTIVRHRLLPHVDVTSMSRLAVGNSGWSQATPAQRQVFAREFTQLIINTYSGALRDYQDEKINVKPLRGNYAGQKYVTIHSEILRTRGPNIPLSYSLVAQGGQWRIYDMNVEGVSIVHSFRNQFANELRKSGFAGLIQLVQAHNRK